MKRGSSAKLELLRGAALCLAATSALACASTTGEVVTPARSVHGRMGFGVTSTTSHDITPGAEVYINGGLAGKAPATFTTGNAADQIVTVHAPGFKDQDIALKSKVRPVPIVLDVLLSLTIIGVAGPIADALLGTFSAVRPDEIDVKLEPAGEGPTPVRDFAYAPPDPPNPTDYAPGAVETSSAIYAP